MQPLIRSKHPEIKCHMQSRLLNKSVFVFQTPRKENRGRFAEGGVMRVRRGIANSTLLVSDNPERFI